MSELGRVIKIQYTVTTKIIQNPFTFCTLD